MTQLDFFLDESTQSIQTNTSEKLCVSCKKVQQLEEFRVLVRRIGDRHTLSSTCRTCDDTASVVKSKYRKRNPIPEDYRCPLCDRSHEDYIKTGRYLTQSPFSVDHCHETMEVRGWICNPCNSAMGLAQHDPELLIKMAEYLNGSS